MKKKHKLRVYLSGQMTGCEDFNFPEFNKAAKVLREAGFEVLNPAEHTPHTHKDWAWYLIRDLQAMRKFKPDRIALLYGKDHSWKNSVGAKIEAEFAKKLGAEVYEFQSL